MKSKIVNSAVLRLPPTAIAAVPWLLSLAVGVCRRRKWKTQAMRVVFGLLDNPATAEAGRLLFGVYGLTETRRLLFDGYGLRGRGSPDFMRDAFAKVSDAMLVRHALPEAAEAMAASDPERVKALLQRKPRVGRLSSRQHLSLARTSAYLGYADGVDAFTAGLPPRMKPEAEALKRLFEGQKRAARTLGTSADYPSVRKAAHKIGENQENKPDAPIKIGLFDYRSPEISSTNLGDFIQTLGVVGQLSRFDFTDLKAPEIPSLRASGATCGLLAKNPHGDAQSIERAVEIVPVNRDFPITAAAEDGPIWLPVCGQFGQPAYPDQSNTLFSLPFPGNVRPLFMAFHIADPDFLDEESLAWLKRFAPIGCRDLFTARLLRGAGVPAFFNGCVTMTLDRLKPPHAGARVGKYDTVLRKPVGDYDPSPHIDKECLARDFDGNLNAALALLDRYHTAKEVRADRLNAYLPCRAMGVPVALTLNPTDRRLDGLADLGDEAFREVAAQFDSIAQPVLAAVLEGKGEAETYALWRKAVAPAMARTDAMIAERNAKHPLPEVSLNDLGLDRIPRQGFGAQRTPEDNEIHLLFAFDGNLAEVFPGTFEGVWRYATRPLVAHVFGRGLDAGMFERWASQFPGVRFVWHDCSGVAYGVVWLKGKTTISTMDRLLAPALLPDVEKILWLDMDVLVRKDVSALFDTDLGDALLAARRNGSSYLRAGAAHPYLYPDRFGHYRDSKEMRKTFRNAFFSGGATVFAGFNPGVMVMNLARMRSERGIVEKMLSLFKACRVGDDCIFNCAVRERAKLLPWWWNHYLFWEIQEDPAIVHFMGAIKPWAEHFPTSFEDEWRENMARARARLP